LHVAVDDHSRMAFTQLLPDQMAETTIGFLHSAVEFFARYGIAVRALLTDNGSCYRSRLFAQACQQMQIKHAEPSPIPRRQTVRRSDLSRPPCTSGPRKTLEKLRPKRPIPASME